jgi:hypothetical protein
LRDLRTPLVTGYLYLLAMWMTFGQSRLLPDDGNVIASRVADLRDIVGLSFSVAAISLGAYLLGSLLVVRSTSWIEDVLLPRARRSFKWRDRFWAVWDFFTFRLFRLVAVPFDRAAAPARTRLEEWLAEVAGDLNRRGITAEVVMSDRSLPSGFVQSFGQSYEHQFPEERAKERGLDYSDPDNRDWLEKESLQRSLAAALADHLQGRETEALVVRMQIGQPALYDAYDRLHTESEFRLSIFVPLVWLVGVASVLGTPWAALLISAPLLLGYQGLRLRGQAQERITQALSSLAIESPVLGQLQTLADTEVAAAKAVRPRSSRSTTRN